MRPVSHWIAACIACLALGCVNSDVEPIPGSGFAPEPDEQTLWTQAAQIDAQLEKSEGVLHRDAELEQYLDGVAARLLTASAIQAPPVRVRVLMQPDANAFALPNGSLYVHSGLLAPMQSEAQLASVLGHELAHYLKRHALREQRAQQNRDTARKWAVGIVSVAAAAGGSVLVVAAIAATSNQLADQVIRTQFAGYSRDLEREADEQGMAMLRAAGYDPREAVAVFELLRADADAGDEKVPYVYASHPKLQERIESVEELLAEQPAPAGAALRTEAHAFEQRVTDLLLENAELQLKYAAVLPAERALERYVKLRPDDPRGPRMLADAYRRGGPGRTHVNRAVRVLEAAAERFPADAAIQLELGLLYREQGERERARARLSRYLELAPQAADRPIIQRYVAELQ